MPPKKRRWKEQGPCWKSNLGEAIDVTRNADGSNAYTAIVCGEPIGTFDTLTAATLAAERKTDGHPFGRG